MQKRVENPSSINTLADLDHWLLNSESMRPCRRYERRAAIRRTCEWSGRKAEQIPAEPDAIRKVYAGFSPGGLKVKRKTISNNKSALLAAVRACGILPKYKQVDTFTPEFLELWGQLRVPEKRQLSRMFRYASAMQLKPEQVNDAFSTNFLDHLINETLVKHPRVVHQNACRRWSDMNHRLGISLPQLTVPAYMQRLSLPEDVFPPSLWDEFDRFCEMQAKSDYFDERAPAEPLRPATLKAYRQRLLMFISALALAGVPPAEITSLEFCVRQANAKVGLQALLRWRGQSGVEARHSAASCAILLVTVANRALMRPKEDADLVFLRATAKKLRVRHKGMSPRNRKKLVVLKHEANLARLFIMPLAIAKKLLALNDDEITDSDALLLQKVLALVILMFCPLRISTLVSLNLEENFVWAGPRMSGSLMLNVEGHQFKGGHPAVLPVPKVCSDLIQAYIFRFRSRLAPEGCPFLFSGEHVGRPKDRNTLSKQIKHLIFERLGFDVTPHVYRHLVHIVVLNRFPGAYAMVSRVLTHRNINTAIQNYSYMDIELSMREYQKLVLDEVEPGRRRRGASGADVAFGIDREKL